jgi:branched-chain amino acid transport system ATP-binding protein
VSVLEVRGLNAGYDRLDVVHDVSITVMAGEIVGLLGRNGAGKTTTLLAIAGFLSNSSGMVLVDGAQQTAPAHVRARRGLGMVLEGRSMFPSLTVAQNLELARVAPDDVIELFPELRSKLALKAGLLSGGEQQMLSLARAIGRRPRILLIDELSFGLSPILCERIYGRLKERKADMAILLVEQHLGHAVDVVDRALVMNDGRIVTELAASELSASADKVERIYLAAPGA